MATVQLHALSENDKKQRGTVVHSLSGIENMAAGRSPYIVSGQGDDQTGHHMRTIIRLVVPTFNFVLGRSNMTLLWKILGVPKKIYDGIISGNLIMNASTGELVALEDATSGVGYLYMAEIAERMIYDLDIEKRKLECLYGALSDFVPMSTNVRTVFSIDRVESDGIRLVDGYYAHLLEDKPKLKRGVLLEEISDEYPNALFPNSDSAYTYLRNMKQDKSGLFGMLNYSIMVVPEELRPEIDGRKHKLTARYNNVIKYNNDLHNNTVNEGASPNIIIKNHEALNKAVSRLQYKLQGTQRGLKKDDLAVLERVKSKKGQIRKNNLGKRQDYSGRTVVAINPYLPLDTIRIPRTMLPVLLEYHALPYLSKGIRANVYKQNMNEHAANVYDRIKLTNLRAPVAQEEIQKIIKDHHLLDKVPMVMGRQPTLHKQSLQGFHIEPTDFQAIEVNPLVCPAFNMDFDGDQGHVEVPLSEAAIREVRDLMMTTQNIFLAKTGECTTTPRQDMLYGLYICTHKDYVLGNVKEGNFFDTYEDCRQAVMEHKVKVYDTVVIHSARCTCLAGDAALVACYPPGVLVPRNCTGGKMKVEMFYKKTLDKYMELILDTDSNGNFLYKLGQKYAPNNTFVGVINRLVELGFKIARLYPVNMSLVLPGVTVSNEMAKRLGHNVAASAEQFSFTNEIASFHERMSDLDMLYNLGLETDDNYRLEFDAQLDVLSKAVGENMTSMLGKQNGYFLLADSGARGNKDNLNQTFAYKGRVKKNSTESFDALLENSYATQMTPLEGFVAAYGGRQGQMDKSLKTGDTGYAMRQMWHATQGMAITELDCGTTKGITLTKKELTIFSDADDAASIEADIRELFEYTITGRYIAGTNRMISVSEAKALASDPAVQSVTIRSPLTCNNPCCAKCFGIDWSTRKQVVVGTNVGIVAAQSIGEPGTQLTLKQFQKGGVAGKAEVTSAFDRVDNYIHLSDIAAKSKAGRYAGYDPVAWATGKVEEQPAAQIGYKRVTIAGNKQRAIIVPNNVAIRSEAIKGEGLSYRHGDCDMRELMQYAGLDKAQFYLVFKLFSLYRSEVKIRTIHFETLVASMVRFMILETDRSDLYVGQYCTRHELMSGDISRTRYTKRLCGVKQLTEDSMDALDAIIMESQGFGLSRTCLLNMQDSLTKPINRMLLGMTITNGSSLPGFIEARKVEI